MLPLDVHPVRVEHSDGRVWTGCRILVDRNHKVGIWHGQNQLAYAAQTEGAVNRAPKGTPAAEGPWTLDAPDGTLTVTREGGCGCGSPLKVLGEMDLARAKVTAASPQPAVAESAMLPAQGNPANPATRCQSAAT